jgi:hypothetical protein
MAGSILEGADGQVIDWFVQAKVELAPGATVRAL